MSRSEKILDILAKLQLLDEAKISAVDNSVNACLVVQELERKVSLVQST